MEKETYIRDGEFLECSNCHAKTRQVSCRHKANCSSIPVLAFLTPRQREIAILVGRTKTNLEIAEHLNITVSTVEVHRADIFRRMGVHSVGDLVHRMYTLGVFVPEIKSKMSDELANCRPLQPVHNGGKKFGNII